MSSLGWRTSPPPWLVVFEVLALLGVGASGVSAGGLGFAMLVAACVATPGVVERSETVPRADGSTVRTLARTPWARDDAVHVPRFLLVPAVLAGAFLAVAVVLGDVDQGRAESEARALLLVPIALALALGRDRSLTACVRWLGVLAVIVGGGWTWHGPLQVALGGAFRVVFPRVLLLSLAVSLAPTLHVTLASLCALKVKSSPRRRLAHTIALVAIPLGLCAGAAFLWLQRPLALDYGDRRWPLLEAGEAIAVDAPITGVETFAPLFGAERSVVNPRAPVVSTDGRSVAFPQPGEYYVVLNGTTPIKVCVYERGEAHSKRALRLFDFCVANLVWNDAHDARFGADRGAYTDLWIRSREPGLLLCSPTSDLFRLLVEDSLALPTRMATAPGMTRTDEGVRFTTHNVPEVYLPDQGRWVMFDINQGFVARWQSATNLAQAIRTRFGVGALDEARFAELGLDIYPDAPRPRHAKSKEAGLLDALVFDPEMIGTRPVRDGWADYGALFSGGVAYYGEGMPWLGGHYVFGEQHDDPELRRQAVVRAEAFFGREIVVVPIAELKRRIATDPRVAARAWERDSVH